MIYGNYIGINLAGTVIAGSGENGILLETGAANTTIGGTGTGLANVITGNGWGTQWTAGISITSTAGAGNSIIANSIYGNVGLGIDLGTSGVTANDNLDGDTGANNLQNSPVITYGHNQWYYGYDQRHIKYSCQHSRNPDSFLRDSFEREH